MLGCDEIYRHADLFMRQPAEQNSQASDHPLLSKVLAYLIIE